MSEIIINTDLIYLALALATAGGTVIGWAFRHGKREGIDETCAERIETQLNQIAKKLDEEIKNTDASHNKIHERIERVSDKVDKHAATLHEKINIVNQSVKYLEGQLDSHIESKKD